MLMFPIMGDNKAEGENQQIHASGLTPASGGSGEVTRVDKSNVKGKVNSLKDPKKIKLHLRDVDSDCDDPIVIKEVPERAANEEGKVMDESERLRFNSKDKDVPSRDTAKLCKYVSCIVNKIKSGKPPVVKINTQPQQEDPRLIEDTESLENQRFKASFTKDQVGSYLKLRMLKQYPNQQDDVTPLFELAELEEKYEQMEKDMVHVYKKFSVLPCITYSSLKVGMYAVLKSRKYEEAEAENENDPPDWVDIPVFRRIKVLKIFNRALVRVEYIDYGAIKEVNTVQSTILMLDKSFAVLPPRVCDIEMEGLSHYKDGLLRKYVCSSSEEFVFDGLLTAKVQASGKVIVWSERFPMRQFKYGINGYILCVMWCVIGRVLRLAPQGHHKRDCYVVNADHEGYVDIQVNSAMSRHFLEVFTSVSYDTIEPHLGSVTRVQKGEIYMAPHAKSNGKSYYRAIISESPREENFQTASSLGDDEVHIEFMDYGDKANVKIKDLIRAKDAHYLLSKFPKMCIKVHLDNIWALEAEKYFAMYHSADQLYTVHVVKSTLGEPPEVLIKRDNGNGTTQILNKEIVDKGLAGAILPFKQFDELVDHGPKIMNLVYKAHLYNRLENGRRLKVLDELDVDVIYNKAMPDGYFFIRPTSHQSKWLDFEMELDSMKQQIKQITDVDSNYYNNWIIDRRETFSGMSVLCDSRIVKQFARAVLVGPVGRKCVEEQNEDDENEDKSLPRAWEVYLPDYGVSEKFYLDGLLQTEVGYASQLPFGCLASHKELDTKDKLWNWWDSLQDHGLSARHGIDYIYSMLFDRNYYSKHNKVERRVRIKAIKLNHTYGETLLVEWC